MLKGSSIANIVILIGMLLSLFFIIFSDLTPFWYEGQKDEAVLHRNIYMMENSLDAAKSYMDTSLSYSAYQACYDALRKMDNLEDEEDFRTSLEVLVGNYLNRYREGEYYFMSNYPVNIPRHLVIVESLNPLRLKAEAESKVYISKEIGGVESRLEAVSAIEKTVPVDCYGMFLKGRAVGREMNSSIGDLVKAKVDSWPKSSQDLPGTDSLEAEIGAIPGLAFERSEGNYDISSGFEEASVEITGYEQSGSGPYENIRYGVSVKIRVTVRDTRDDQVFPVYDGKKDAFTPLGTEFLFEESYST